MILEDQTNTPRIHSIEAARKGFMYQDKVALFKFLESFFNIIKPSKLGFYVDYNLGFTKQQSIDFFLQKDEEKNFFEVKTGENFLKNKKKRWNN